MAKVKARKTPIDPTAKKMRRGRKIHIYTPDEKRKFSAMSAHDRYLRALNLSTYGKSDPVAVALGQSARQQEELEAAKRTEAVLWATYAMCGGYMSKKQRERLHVILKKMADGVWYPSLTEMWIRKGKKLKARVLGTSTARPVRSKKGGK